MSGRFRETPFPPNLYTQLRKHAQGAETGAEAGFAAFLAGFLAA
jgi:hypothetical protein